MMRPDEMEAMLGLYELGWGTKRVAAEFCCSRNTVRRYVAAAGWVAYGGGRGDSFLDDSFLDSHTSDSHSLDGWTVHKDGPFIGQPFVQLDSHSFIGPFIGKPFVHLGRSPPAKGVERQPSKSHDACATRRRMYELERARQVYSVSELTAAVRHLIEQGFPPILVEGEVSNFRSPGRAGHWYFTLKDGQAQVRCAMFANRSRFVRRPLRDGALVVVRCRLSLYEARGEFQAIVDAVEPAGEGELRAAFERLKVELEREGLFAADRKRALPPFPRHIGIVSSLSGAALQDVLAVLRRRFPCVRATCFAATVQGAEAVSEVIGAIDRAEASKPRPDVLLLTRGGGSLEDLMAFNSAALARRMAQCPIPIVSAVGHETDVTIADFVADQRAPTPSAAAEMVTPDRAELLLRVHRRAGTLTGRALDRFQSERRVLAATRRRLVHPARSLEQRMQRADELRERLLRAIERRTGVSGTRLGAARRLLAHANPDVLIERAADRAARAREELVAAAQRRLDASQSALAGLRRALRAVSPLDTLDRGYAIVSRPDGTRWGAVIAEAGETRTGEAIQAHLASGTIDATVTAGPRPADEP